MADGKSGVRAPLVSCVLNLLTSNPRRRHELVEAGFVSTLRHLCDWTGAGGGGVSPGGVGASVVQRHQINSEDDKDAAGLARRVLDLMDTGVIGDML